MSYSGKRLYRDKFEGKLIGLCAGLGDYFDIDPTILRIVLVLVTIFSGLFIFIIPLYFLLALIIPKKPPEDYTSSLEKTFGGSSLEGRPRTPAPATRKTDEGPIS